MTMFKLINLQNTNNILSFLSYKKKGSAIDQILSQVYDRLDEMDNKDDFNLTKQILWLRYSLTVPDDLIDIAYNEIMDDGYYNLSFVPNPRNAYSKVLQRKTMVQKSIRRQYRIKWYNAIGWKEFPDYVRQEVEKDFRRMDFKSLSNFFINREYISYHPKKLVGYIKHPKNGLPIWGINVNDLLKKFHDQALEVEEKIERRLNFIPNDECCADEPIMEPQQVYPTFKPLPTTTTSKPSTQPTVSSWNPQTTPTPFTVPVTDNWDFVTATTPSNIEGSSDFDTDEDNNDDDSFYSDNEYYDGDNDYDINSDDTYEYGDEGNDGIDDGFSDFDEEETIDEVIDNNVNEDEFATNDDYVDDDLNTENDYEEDNFGVDEFEKDDFGDDGGDDFGFEDEDDFGFGDDDDFL